MIIVSPLSAVPRLVVAGGVSHVLGCLGPESQHPELGLKEQHHLRLTFHDIIDEMNGLQAPTREHVEKIVGFVEGWDRSGKLLIHCWAGISRSTAAAFITLCALNPEASEHEAARTLRRASPTAYPNRLLVALADEALSRNGRMMTAVEEIGRGKVAEEAEVFALPARLAA